RVAGNFFEFGVTNTYSLGCPRQGTNRMSRFEGGLHGLKANPSAGADDQNCRHASKRLSAPPLIVMCGLGSRTARWTRGLNTPADALTSSQSRRWWCDSANGCPRV